jgi:hypothetical protein
MKNIIKALILSVLFACGSPSDEFATEDSVGTLEQALTWPSGFGWKNSDFTRCTSPSSTVCVRPFDKKIFFNFAASTCSSWWQTRAVEAWSDWTSLMDDLGWEYHDSSTGVQLKCGAIAGSTIAQFNATKVLQADGDYTFTKGTAIIDTADIESQLVVGWSGKTDVQHQRFARNVILHELMHMSGLGHGGSGTLMAGYNPNTWYTTLKFPTTEENNWMADFVP